MSTERAGGPFLGSFGGVLGLGPGLFGPILSLNRPIWELCDRIWAISGAPGPGFGPFWAYLKPKSVNFGALGQDLGHLGGSWAWVRAFLGLFYA